MIVTPKSRIGLVRQEIKANLGIHKLYGLVKQILNPQCDEDLYVVFINKAHNRLLVLHVDPAGVDLTTRYLFKGLFAQSPYLNDITDLTLNDLRRLLFDGSYENYSWQNPLAKVYLTQNQLSH